MKADDKAVSGEATVKCLFGCITWGVNKFANNAFVKSSGSGISIVTPTGAAKETAVCNALEAAKADVLLAATYRIDTTDNYGVYKVIKCKGIGYPAVVKGVK